MSWAKGLFLQAAERRYSMDLNGIKKILAGLTIAGLLAGTTLTVTSCENASKSS